MRYFIVSAGERLTIVCHPLALALTCFLALFGNSNLLAQTDQDASTLKLMGAVPSAGSSVSAGDIYDLSERFFESLKESKIDEAFDQLLIGSRLLERVENINMFKARTQQAVDEYGRFVGYELLELLSVGSHLKRLTYVSLSEKYPMRWRLYFYRFNKTWSLIDIRVDDNVPALFKEEEHRGGPTTN